MMNTNLYFCLIIAILLCSCGHKKKNKETISIPLAKEHQITYAKGFTIKEFENFKLLEVFNPWQGANNVNLRYILYKSEAAPETPFPGAVTIKVPIKRIVCMSTTHIGFLDKLGEIESIVGIANAGLINNTKLHNRFANNLVADVGYEQNVNFELLIGLNPDLLMSYSIGSEITGLKQKMQELEIDMLINAEYLESHPLGKAEWIKFVGALYGKQAMADSIFQSIEKEYLGLIKKTETIDTKPTVLTGLPWKGSWYIAGGKSYAAKLIADAGGQFLWHENTSHEALGLNLEVVLDKAINADFWINTGAANSLNDIEEVDERLLDFEAINTKTVFNNNARQSPLGGNDYWESGIMNPHQILADLIKIFHPGLLPDSSLVYYTSITSK